ncbi:PAS domain S-box protein [Mariprofundus sp. EBB-1]|uniref:hybrid sensor histidine kinase/response regulator n=1 Tax=Mariprofundus sp. EBB-1 TaxID=2650971 RepID=UPI0011C42C33|nr:PAS domain S-box protein [Mariprofundus sp. EBB-1]
MNRGQQHLLLQALIDSIPDLIFFKDKESVYLGCNRAFEVFVGLARDEIVGKKDIDLFAKDVADFFRQKDREMLASGETSRNEEWVDYPDGSRVLLDTLKTLYYADDGSQLGLIGISRDITQLHESREALNASLSLQRATLESTADGILDVGSDGKWNCYNNKFVEMWNLPSALVEAGDDQGAIAHVLGQLVHPNAFVEKLMALYATPDASSYDEVLFKDGRIFERYSIPQRLGEKIVGRVWSFRDVSKSRRNETKLREQAAFAANNPAPVIRVNEDGRVHDMNPAALTLFGSEFQGQAVQQVPGLGDLNLPRYIRNNQQVMRTGEVDGSVYQWTIKGVEELGVVYVYGSNITELKWMKEHIHNSSGDLKRILDCNPVATIVTRLVDGTLFYGNQATADMFGVPIADLIGQKTMSSFVNPDDRKQVMETLVEKGQVDQYELYLQKIDGTRFWVSTSLRLMAFDGEQCVIASFYDLSEIKAHDAAIQASEKRYRDLVEVLPDALVIHQAGHVVFANSEAAQMFGYDDVEVALGVDFRTHVHPDSLPLAMQRVEALMQGGVLNATAEQTLLRSNGEPFVAEVRSAVTSFNGAPAIVVSLRDVSERKHSEMMASLHHRVLESLTTKQPLVNSLNILAETCESMHVDLRISVMMKKGNKLFPKAYPSLSMEFRKVMDGMLIGADNCSCGAAAFYGKRVISESVRCDPLWDRYRAQVLPLHVNAAWSEPIIGADGKVLGTFAMLCSEERCPNAREIETIEEAAKLAALAIEYVRADAVVTKLTQSVEHAAEAIIISDPKNRIEYVNQAFTRITGYSADEVKGKSTVMLKADSQDEVFYKDMFRHMLNGKAWQKRIRCQRKNGEEYTAQVSVAGIRNRKGRLTQLTAVYEDLTHYEHLEEQLRQSQKMEAVGTLVGGIAHDFNNMLAGMTGQLYLLRKEVAALPSSLQRIEAIESQAFRAAEIIEQLLTFARKGRVAFKSLPLTTLVKETMKLHKVAVPENIELDIQLHQNDITVNGDAGMIQQILLNLISNARDAVELVRSPRISIVLNTQEKDDGTKAACLEVMDNGVGINEEMLGRICEPFFTTKEVGKGTGLGLSMVYGAVQSHGGSVSIKSQPGKGTTVQVLLPVLSTPAKLQRSQQPSVIAPGHAQTILLADDEDMLREVMVETLEQMGYRVLSASDGAQAWKLFEEHVGQIQLAILDVVMPHVGGAELSKRIRQVEPELPVIFYTGYDQESLLDGELHHKYCRVISKPVMIEELSLLIHEMIPSEQESE